MLGRIWLLGRSVESLDGINGDQWRREQLADARDVAGSGLAVEEPVVADAVEARRQDMHQEAADELVGMKRHLLVHGDAKGKGTSGSNREAESTDAPARGALPRSSEEAG